jgi:hypothetical protein
MNIDLQIFHYALVKYKDEFPKLVTWSDVGMPNNDIGHDSQYFKFGFQVESVENGSNITIEATFGIPYHFIEPAYPKGSFNLYTGTSTFFVPLADIDPVTAGEVAINHFGKMSAAILFHTYQATNGERPYFVQLPSLAKIILQAESVIETG